MARQGRDMTDAELERRRTVRWERSVSQDQSAAQADLDYWAKIAAHSGHSFPAPTEDIQEFCALGERPAQNYDDSIDQYSGRTWGA